MFLVCFGVFFMLLYLVEYVEMLGEKMQAYNVNVWLVNVGWMGGVYGIGYCMSFKYICVMIMVVLCGELDDVDYYICEIFGLSMLVSCFNVFDEVFDLKWIWVDVDVYDVKVNDLAECFNKNFEKFVVKISDEIFVVVLKVLVSQ